MGAPPVDFQNERVFVESVAADMKTVTLRAPLEYTHISTFYVRPDGEYIDLSAEVAILSRNVKIQGDEASEIDSWGGHTEVAFGAIYRLENAEFYRMGQQGEMSRYPIHFHVTRNWGKYCYAKHNSIHHSFQRAVAIHSTDHTLVQGNVGFDIVGHMFFVETGMEYYNTLEGNLGIGAIPLLSGMMESDQEPSGFWTAAPNNVWIGNVAVTGSDGWYFQLPGHPISHSIDIFSKSICPVGEHVGQFRGNRCHHTTGTCIRVYQTWVPSEDPCNTQSPEAPQILFNTTCWGVGNNCFSAMKGRSIHNHHMTSIEGGSADIFHVRFDKGGSYNGAKWRTDWVGISHVKESVFVGILPENFETNTREKWKGVSISMPQDENWWVENSTWVNFRRVPIFMDCTACWSVSKWRQGAFTYRFRTLAFVNSSKRIFVQKKGIFHDLDGTLTGTPESYTTWADKHNLGQQGCQVIPGLVNVTPDETMGLPSPNGPDSGGLDMTDSIFHVIQGGLLHSRRDFSFITCTQPIRKFEIAYPEPWDVYLRQLNITNMDTNYTHIYEYETKEVFGWTFPVVSNIRIVIRLNLLGLDFQQASVRYGSFDQLMLKEADAKLAKKAVATEWLQLVVESTSAWHHYNLISPDWELLATRWGQRPAGLQAQRSATEKEALLDVSAFDNPADLHSLSHGMLDNEHWTVVFRHPSTGQAPLEKEPLSLRFEAKRCPEEGCILGLPPLNFNWTEPKLWSAVFGPATGEAVIIEAEDWIIFDLESVSILNLTIFGKLSFDDNSSKTIETNNIVVWGLLEIGNETNPFGSGAANASLPPPEATIVLRGGVLDTDTYVYIEEQTLHNKLVAVAGRVETYGMPVLTTWLRMESTAAQGATSACLLNVTDAPLDWPAGSQVVIAPTEFDNPAGDVESRVLSEDAYWDNVAECWRLTWTGGLSKDHYAGTFSVGNGQMVELRSVIARTDRNVIFTSKDLDGNNLYGGHIEIFDILSPRRAGSVNMRYTQFSRMGKGGLSAAVKIGYSGPMVPRPNNIFIGCSWTDSEDYGLHADCYDAPFFAIRNTFARSRNGGIFTFPATRQAQIVWNAVIGVSMSPKAPVATNEASGGQRVINYAGIRTDDLPVKMIRNVVAGSNDMGFMHDAEGCSPFRVFNNEAFAVIVGAFVLPGKEGNCQSTSLYKLWKAAHIGLFLADIGKSTVRVAHVTIADSHLGFVPYFSVGSSFRRLLVRDTIIIGSSPASSCSKSQFCRTQSTGDPYHETCGSIFAPVNFRRVGYVVPFNTANRKTCETTMDPRQCRLMSPAFVNLDDCHFPYEFHNHFDRGLGWSFFTRITFAYFKESDCGRTSRAISQGVSGAEINFPGTFESITWYEVDPVSKFEMSAAVLNSAYRSRKSPCKYDGGGCMGLDQLLFQDADGTFIGLEPGTPGSVLPLSPRTELIWSSMCTTSINNVEVHAMICVNETIQLVEMRNLDRGAKDVKFGPWVLNPKDEEDNGFEGGVISSVGPFYAVCPCGWDFSFYHILVKPNATYDAEVMSLPENFKLRYWSPNPGDSIALHYFYPDSRGVNVFVGGAAKADMSIKLARVPLLDDAHGAHVVDAQALKLYITLRGSPEGFAARRDLVVRRTPTVKLKMNVEISISEFNAENFQTNLAILLGIPPERIKIVAVAVRRRLQQGTMQLLNSDSDAEQKCAWAECEDSPRRLAAAASSTSLDVNIEPSSDFESAQPDDDGTAMQNQATELQQVASVIESARDSNALASAAGATVQVTELNPPADVVDDEVAVTDEDVATPADVDVLAIANSQEAIEVSIEAPCDRSIGAFVVVGGVSGTAYLSATLASGSDEGYPCSSINPGLENNITLSCTAGILNFDTSGCTPRGCSGPINVTIGATTGSVALSSTISSGVTRWKQCSEVEASYTGAYELSCTEGVLTAVTSSCTAGCLASDAVNITVAGNTVEWSPSSNVVSGTELTTPCGPINSGYEGQIRITCYFGVLSVNPSACSAKSCKPGDNVNITLGGDTAEQATLGVLLLSGLTTSIGCNSVNDSYSGDVTLRCMFGILSPSTDGCIIKCAANVTIPVALGGNTSDVAPSVSLDVGTVEYNRQCSELHTGFEGLFNLLCDGSGVLSADVSQCTEVGCDSSTSAMVTVGGTSTTVSPDSTVASGSTWSAACSQVNAGYTGIVYLPCSRGELSSDTSGCTVRPCEPWDFFIYDLYNVSGLVYPLARISLGSYGTGDCGAANVEYSGLLNLTCSSGQAEVIDYSDCQLTCYLNSPADLVIDDMNLTVVPASRIPHAGTYVQPCGTAAWGYVGNIELACAYGNTSVLTVNCSAGPCAAGTTINLTLGDEWGTANLYSQVESNEYGAASCTAVNPWYTGDLNVSCYAGNLTLVSMDGCRQTCNTSGQAMVFIGRSNFSVYPAEPIVHGAEGWQNCSEVVPGYSAGMLQFSCSDGVLEVVNESCVPDNCTENTSVLVEIGGLTANGSISVDTDTPHETAWTIECETLNWFYIGQIDVECYAGQLLTNTTGCISRPCPEGSFIESPCSDKGSLWSGLINTTCWQGRYISSEADCVLACAASATTSVVSTGGNFVVRASGQLAHGASEDFDCGLLGSEYTGSYSIACNMGVLASTNLTCMLACSTSSTVSSTVDGITRPVGPTTQFHHGLRQSQLCSVQFPGYMGNITLECNDGSVSIVDQTCEPTPCYVTTGVRVQLDRTTMVYPSNYTDHGANFSHSCDLVDPNYDGTIFVGCILGTLSADTSDCHKACANETTTPVMVTNGSFTLSPTDRLAHGFTESISCEVGLHPLYSGNVTLNCTDGVLDATPDCKLSCATYTSTQLGLGTRSYRLNAPSLIPHSETAVQACSAAVVGYTGWLWFTCDDGSVSVTNHSCVPLPCSIGTAVAVTLGNMSDFFNLTAEVSSGSSADGDCSSVNPYFSGSFTVSCEATFLVVASISGCDEPCYNMSSLRHSIEGATYDVVLGELIMHNTTREQDCELAASGYTGSLFLRCDDGQLQVYNDTCTPKPCDTSASVQGTLDGAVGSLGVSAQVASGSTAKASCSAVNLNYTGDVELQCTRGVLTVASYAQCKRRCLTSSSAAVQFLGRSFTVNPSAAFSHSETTMKNCSSFATGFSGQVTLQCTDGTTSVVATACTPDPCEAGQSVTATVGGNSGPVSLSSQVPSGFSGYVDCANVNSLYTGTIELSCEAAVLTVSSVSGCLRSCPTSSSLDVMLQGMNITVQPSQQIVSNGAETKSCQTNPILEGSWSLQCTNGVLTADTSGCAEKSCPQGQAANVTLGAEGFDISLPQTLASRSGLTTSCSLASVNHTGDLVINCTIGALTIDNSSCIPVGLCLSSQKVNVTVGGVVTEVSPAEQMMTYTTMQVACSDVNTEFSGYFELSCTMGALSVKSASACLKTCSTSSSVSATVMGTTVALHPKARITSGSFEERQCDTDYGGYDGTLRLDCLEGNLTANVSECSPRPCSQGQSIVVSLGAFSSSIAAPRALVSGDSFTVDCTSLSSWFIGTFTMSCTLGALSADTSGCLAITTTTTTVTTTTTTVTTSTVTTSSTITTTTTTVDVVKVVSTIVHSVLAAAGQTAAQVQAALSQVSIKLAYAKSIASSLGLDPSVVNVISIVVSQLTRRLDSSEDQTRHLQSTGSWGVQVGFEVLAHLTPVDTDTISQKVTRIASSGAEENTAFSDTLTQELVAAAAADTSSSASVLQDLAQTVAASGVTVQSVDTPVVVSSSSTAAPSPGPEEESNTGLVVGLVLAGLFIVALSVAVGVLLFVYRAKLFGPRRSPYVADDVVPMEGQLSDSDDSPQMVPRAPAQVGQEALRAAADAGGQEVAAEPFGAVLQ